MKKLIITCALVAFGSMVSFAQSAKSTNTTKAGKSTQAAPKTHSESALEQTATKNANDYKKKLGLRADQYNAIYNVELEYLKQQQAMSANGAKPTDGQSMQARMGKDQRFQNVLTPEQYAKYQSSYPAAAPAKTN
jgi:hypothetical protein